MSLKALQEYTRYSKYARYINDKKRRETWDEQVDRVFGMHEQKFADILPQIQEDFDFAKEMVRKRRVLGSQRALQFGGKAILDKEARLYNCTVSYVDRPRFFQECFWLLLCGCGAGFSVQKHHVARLPKIGSRDKGEKTYVIPDTIEGWSDALGILLASYWQTTRTEFSREYKGYKINFDYSLIRPEGSPLSWGGKAPGHEGLKAALEKIENLIETKLLEGQNCLRPIDAYDITMHASDAVLSGGIRRSATICLFSFDDEEMINAKTGNWFVTNPQRGRSNNSAILVRDEVTKEQFDRLMKSVQEFGEPGFVWTENKEGLFNPCVEIGMWAYWENDGSDEWVEAASTAYEIVNIDGKECISGWQFCNLCEQNMRRCRTKEEFLDSCRASAILGTMQSAYDWFEYLGIVSHKIVAKEALLGVSMTGMMDSPDIAFDPKIQREGARLILKVNEELAAKIGVNPCARATCVKPAGTTSCILGTASGVHPHHAKRYIRRVQANKLEFPALLFEQYNPRAVESSVWSANNTDIVLSFMCEVPDGAKTKNQVDAITLLEHVKLTQQNWVEAGTRRGTLSKPWLRHNVSNTCTVRPDEWDKVGSYIYRNRKWFAGISLLPVSGDKDYPQAPFTAIYTPAEIVREYGDGSLMASGLIVDGLRAFKDNLWAACDCALGIGENLELSDDERKLNNGKLRSILDEKLEKADWVRRAKQFAQRYCSIENDDVIFAPSRDTLNKEEFQKEFEEAKERQQIKRATYLMKDVHNWKLWCDLKREYVDIDWSLVVEEDHELGEEFGKAGEACSNGVCDLMGMKDTSDLEREKLRTVKI